VSQATFGMSLDLGSLARALQADRQAIAGATRPAAQAGAQVLYDAVRSNASRIRRRTGKLAASIYQAYATNESAPATATYYVSWRTSGKAGLPRAPHGHLVEFGFLQRYEITRDPKTGRFFTHKDRPLPAPRQIPAQPFVRPAAAQQPAALAAAEKRFLEILAEKGLTQ
jgi:hypothetical protein